MFKKKNKRSEWFQGLLQAEELYKEGYEYSFHTGLTLWFVCGDSRIGIPGPTMRKVGALDYARHRLDNNEIFQKDSQEY